MNPSLFNVPGEPEALGRWSFINATEHLLISTKLQEMTGLQQQTFILDPIAVNDLQSWLWRHQSVHNAMNAALNIQGNDLTDVNFQDPKQLESWVWIHAQEHIQATAILGI